MDVAADTILIDNFVSAAHCGSAVAKATFVSVQRVDEEDKMLDFKQLLYSVTHILKLQYFEKNAFNSIKIWKYNF